MALSQDRGKRSVGVHGVRAYHFGTPGETSDGYVSDINSSIIPFFLLNIHCAYGNQGRKGTVDRAPGTIICLIPAACARSAQKPWHSLPLEAVLGKGVSSHGSSSEGQV